MRNLRLCILLLLTACYQRELSDHEKVFRAIKGECATLARSKYQLKTYGIDYPIYEKPGEINIRFSYQGIMTVEQARELMVHLTNDFIQVIKSNENSAKYIAYEPTLVRSCNLAIGFETQDVNHQGRGFFLIDNRRGHLSYLMYDSEDPQDLNRVTFLEETFEQASQIVAEEDKLNAQVGEAKCAAL